MGFGLFLIPRLWPESLYRCFQVWAAGPDDWLQCKRDMLTASVDCRNMTRSAFLSVPQRTKRTEAREPCRTFNC